MYWTDSDGKGVTVALEGADEGRAHPPSRQTYRKRMRTQSIIIIKRRSQSPKTSPGDSKGHGRAFGAGLPGAHRRDENDMGRQKLHYRMQ